MVADVLMIEDYRQPSFYRFNEDSTALVRYINDLKLGDNVSFLDIGTGCGIIGIELARLNPLWKGTLLEPQREFLGYIKENQLLYKKEYLDVVVSSFEKASFENSFDLIFFNPPYFFENQARPSSNQNRHMCRQINEEAFKNWFEILPGILSKQGKVIFCFRSNESWLRKFKPSGLGYRELKKSDSIDIHFLEKLA